MSTADGGPADDTENHMTDEPDLQLSGVATASEARQECER